jgi:hypothetical protein
MSYLITLNSFFFFAFIHLYHYIFPLFIRLKLTAWSSALFEKLRVPQLVKKSYFILPTFCYRFTRVRQLYKFWKRSIQSTSSYLLSLRYTFGAFGNLWKVCKPHHICASVCLKVRTEQLGSRCKDFHEIFYLNIFRKPVENIQVSLKSDKNNGHFTRRRIDIYGYISLISSQDKKYFRQNLERTIKTHNLRSINIFRKNVPFVR